MYILVLDYGWGAKYFLSKKTAACYLMAYSPSSNVAPHCEEEKEKQRVKKLKKCLAVNTAK